MALTVKELKEFISDLPDDTKVVLETILIDDEQYCSEVIDITYSETYLPEHTRILSLSPKEIEINDTQEDGRT